MDNGRLSSQGPLEETASPVILEDVLKSLAHALVYGPLPTKDQPAPFRFHVMNLSIDRYLHQKNELEFMRASAFFSTAYIRDAEEEVDFDDFGVHEESIEVSVMAVQDLVNFYGLETKIKERIQKDKGRSLENAYEDISSQRDLSERDRYWASVIAEVSGLGFISKALKAWAANNTALVRSPGYHYLALRRH